MIPWSVERECSKAQLGIYTPANSRSPSSWENDNPVISAPKNIGVHDCQSRQNNLDLSRLIYLTYRHEDSLVNTVVKSRQELAASAGAPAPSASAPAAYAASVVSPSPSAGTSAPFSSAPSPRADDPAPPANAHASRLNACQGPTADSPSSIALQLNRLLPYEPSLSQLQILMSTFASISSSLPPPSRSLEAHNFDGNSASASTWIAAPSQFVEPTDFGSLQSQLRHFRLCPALPRLPQSEMPVTLQLLPLLLHPPLDPPPNPLRRLNLSRYPMHPLLPRGQILDTVVFHEFMPLCLIPNIPKSASISLDLAWYTPVLYEDNLFRLSIASFDVQYQRFLTLTSLCSNTSLLTFATDAPT